MDRNLLTEDVINLITFDFSLDGRDNFKEKLPKFNYFDQEKIKQFFLHINNINNFRYFEELYEFLNEYTNEDINIYDDLVITSIDQFGGEGLGSDYYVILKLLFKGEETFWKIPGWYQSYQGFELEPDNTFQVIPKEKTITVFEEIK